MIIMDENSLHDQAGMERAFRAYFEDVYTVCPGTVNALVNARLQSCDYSEQWVVLSAETAPWMANPGGILHGGITAAYLDLVMGLLCRYYSGGRMNRTIHMDVNYLRAVEIGSRICVRAEISKLGRGICFSSGSIWREDDPTRLLATATAAYSVEKT